MIFHAPNTKRNRIASVIAISLGLVVGFFIVVSGSDSDKAESELSASAQDTQVVNSVSSQTPDVPQLPESQLEDVDFTSYSTDLATVVGLEIGESRLESTDKIRLFFAPEPGTRIIKTASQTFERDDGAVLLFSRIGLPDDSVKAQEIYAVFSGPGGDVKFNQTLAAYGMRMKCYRGENTTEWQTDLCP